MLRLAPFTIGIRKVEEIKLNTNGEMVWKDDSVIFYKERVVESILRDTSSSGFAGQSSKGIVTFYCIFLITYFRFSEVSGSIESSAGINFGFHPSQIEKTSISCVLDSIWTTTTFKPVWPNVNVCLITKVADKPLDYLLCIFTSKFLWERPCFSFLFGG